MVKSNTKENKGTILIVDDEIEIVNIIGDIVDEAGYTYLTAENGLEGLDQVSKSKIDVIVSDLKMPTMDGMSLLRLVRDNGYWNPFIILTGYADKASSIEALRLGAYDYQQKPFDHDKLKALLIDAMNYSQSFQVLFDELAKAVPNGQASTLKKQLADAASKVMKLKAMNTKMASGE